MACFDLGKANRKSHTIVVHSEYEFVSIYIFCLNSDEVFIYITPRAGGVMPSANSILVIEDDRMTRHMLRTILEDNNFEVSEAQNFQQALGAVQDHRFAAILLDLHLSDGYGADLVDLIRENTDVPILVVSGHDDDASLQECYAKGVNDFITKPLVPDMLIAKIHIHIKRARNKA